MDQVWMKKGFEKDAEHGKSEAPTHNLQIWIWMNSNVNERRLQRLKLKNVRLMDLISKNFFVYKYENWTVA